ncbi:hypothetical protein ACFSUK_29440 [Sphingobium scionense]
MADLKPGAAEHRFPFQLEPGRIMIRGGGDRRGAEPGQTVVAHALKAGPFAVHHRSPLSVFSTA